MFYPLTIFIIIRIIAKIHSQKEISLLSNRDTCIFLNWLIYFDKNWQTTKPQVSYFALTTESRLDGMFSNSMRNVLSQNNNNANNLFWFSFCINSLNFCMYYGTNWYCISIGKILLIKQSMFWTWIWNFGLWMICHYHFISGS